MHFSTSKTFYTGLMLVLVAGCTTSKTTNENTSIYSNPVEFEVAITTPQGDRHIAKKSLFKDTDGEWSNDGLNSWKIVNQYSSDVLSTLYIDQTDAECNFKFDVKRKSSGSCMTESGYKAEVTITQL